jgi:hypothetical protein
VIRIPIGRLLASGAELAIKPRDAGNVDAFRPEGVDEASIPAGTYAVTAFDIDWGDSAELAAEEVARRRSRAGHALESVLGPFTGLLLLVSILGALSPGWPYSSVSSPCAGCGNS